jgi:hypothetical protein
MSIADLFTFGGNTPEQRAVGYAHRVKKDYQKAENLLLEAKSTQTDYLEAQKDLEDFLNDNSELVLDQNVSQRKEFIRSGFLVFCVMAYSLLFGIKGVKFMLQEFVGWNQPWVYIVVTFILAGIFITASIYFRSFADRKTGYNRMFLILTSYIFVLTIPVANVLEVYDSKYAPTITAIIVFICIVDVLIHSALLSMYSNIIAGKDNKKAASLAKKKNARVNKLRKKLERLQSKFFNLRAKLTESTTNFCLAYRELADSNPERAIVIILLLTNFQIFVVNNKIMGHKILPYHADANGSPSIEMRYFNPTEDQLRGTWDFMSSFGNESTQVMDPLPPTEVPPQTPQQPLPPYQEPTLNRNNQPEQGTPNAPPAGNGDGDNKQGDDYDTLFDGNPNEKYV